MRKKVAPYTGAWIEISGVPHKTPYPVVAPYTGAWIEISLYYPALSAMESLPTRERGLKFDGTKVYEGTGSRSLHGSVD